MRHDEGEIGFIVLEEPTCTVSFTNTRGWRSGVTVAPHSPSVASLIRLAELSDPHTNGAFTQYYIIFIDHLLHCLRVFSTAPSLS